MSELLTGLRSKRDELNSNIKVITDSITRTNTQNSTRMKEILLKRFSRVKEVVIGQHAITIQVRSEDERYVHDVTINNRNSLYSNEFSFNPSIQWASGSITKTAVTMMNYINVVAFVSSELVKERSEFCDLMLNSWSGIFTKSVELSRLKNDLNRVNYSIAAEEERIKRESFFNSLKVGNFYYRVRSSYGRQVVYDVIHIDKINPKTVSIMHMVTYGDTVQSNFFDVFNRRSLPPKRVPNEKIYSFLEEYTLFDKKDFLSIITENKYRIGIEYISKSCGLSSLNDIKVLCSKLREYNITTENIPSNDVLRHISKWRYKTLEKNRV